MRNRLALFHGSKPAAARRARVVAVALALMATTALVWPIYDLVGGIYPLVLGIPFSLAWVVFWLFVVFGAILRLYLVDVRSIES